MTTSTPTPFGRSPAEAEDLDVDALLTPEQRRAVYDTPLWGVARVLLGFVLAVLLLVWGSGWLEDRQQVRADFRDTRGRFEQLEARAPLAPPGELPDLFAAWEAADQHRRVLSVDDERAARLRSVSRRAAIALGLQAVLHLSSLELMTATEQVTLAAALHALLQQQDRLDLPADLRRQGPDRIDRVVRRGTQAASRLSEHGATVDELREARYLLLQVSEMADARLRSDYHEAIRRLGERIRALTRQARGEAGAASAGTPEGRDRFARQAQSALAGQGGVSRVTTTGAEGRTLVVEGSVPAARLVELFLRPADLRQRLLARGFRDFQARGSDRSVRLEIATGRLRPDSSGPLGGGDRP